MQATETTTYSMPRRAGVRRAKKHHPRTDMTPMVDLGFLLIAFFVMTTELSKPQVMDLVMPTNKPGPPTKLAESYALTILLKGDRIYCYEGQLDDAINKSEIQLVPDGLSGLGSRVAAKQLKMDAMTGGRKELMVLIKADEHATYQSVVNALDEMLIHKVGKYALVKMDSREETWSREL